MNSQTSIYTVPESSKNDLHYPLICEEITIQRQLI